MRNLCLGLLSALMISGLALAGCNGTASIVGDILGGATAAQDPLASACASLLNLASQAAMAPGMKDLAPYINQGCNGAQAMAKLAANPSSLEWVGQLEGMVKAAAGIIGMKL